MRRFIYLAVLSFVILPFATPAQAVSADAGRITYTNRCASCHGTLTNSWAVSAQTIQSAIQSNRGGMGSLSALSAAELQDIAAYLANPSATTTTATTGTTSTTGSTTGAATAATTPAPTALPSNSDIDRLYDWAESAYPVLFGTRGYSQDMGGYYSRYYSGSNLYLMARDGQLYLRDAGAQAGMVALGKVQDWLAQIPATATASHPQTHEGENEGHGHDSHDSHKGHDDHDDDRDD